jgi:hypothetical protein
MGGTFSLRDKIEEPKHKQEQGCLANEILHHV